MFFMVLDLRLVKIGCRDDNQFFFVPMPDGPFLKVISLGDLEKCSAKQCIFIGIGPTVGIPFEAFQQVGTSFFLCFA